MAKASQAEEPSMEEILASIRRIISDEEEDAGNEAGDAGPASELEDDPVEIEAADEMSESSEMNQDDLDKLFDMDGDDDDATDITAADEDADMAAAMSEMEAEDDDDDVLELTEELAVSDDMSPEMQQPVETDDVAFVEPAPAAEPPVIESVPEPAPSTIASEPVPMTDLPDVAQDAPLTSDNTGEAVHAAFDNLSHMFIGGNAQTVEELVRDMLRPMLKAWLDQNLPGMVEQMVQKEIQRVTRRR